MAAASAALIGIFIAVAVSVVDARRPLDREVSRSFDAVIAKRDRAGDEHLTSRGCEKQRVSVYGCSVQARPLPKQAAVTIRWDLWLAADGCWFTVPVKPPPPPGVQAALDPGLERLEGCTGG